MEEREDSNEPWFDEDEDWTDEDEFEDWDEEEKPKLQKFKLDKLKVHK